MFVTALYAIRPSYVAELKQQFQTLLTLLPEDVDIYVWTDQDMSDVFHPHLHVLFSPLTAFDTYTLCMGSGLTLPEQRTVSKDTQEYMALMNTKLEFLLKAIPYMNPTKETIAWIDCGITKIFKDIEAARHQLRTIANHPWNLTRMLVPGCWNMTTPVSPSVICWRFAGGFFMAPCNLVALLSSLQSAQLRLLVGLQVRLTWEVNVWAMMEEKAPHYFQWYKGDHDNTILQTPM